MVSAPQCPSKLHCEQTSSHDYSVFISQGPFPYHHCIICKKLKCTVKRGIKRTFIHQSADLGPYVNLGTARRENVPPDMCAQRRLKSACTSAQSDQSLRCPYEITSYPWLSKMRPGRFRLDCANAQADLNLRWAQMSEKYVF